MTVTDTLTVELTFVHKDIVDSDLESLTKESYEDFFAVHGADDVHVKGLKHFVTEED